MSSVNNLIVFLVLISLGAQDSVVSPTKPQAAPDINAPEILKLARPTASPLQLPDIVYLVVDVAEQHLRLKNCSCYSFIPLCLSYPLWNSFPMACIVISSYQLDHKQFKKFRLQGAQLIQV